MSLDTIGEVSEKNYKLAWERANQIDNDIKWGHYDPTLAKYGKTVTLTVVPEPPTPEHDLATLWERYVQYKMPQWSESTRQVNCKTFTNHVNNLPTKSLDDAVAIRDYLMRKVSEGFSLKQVKRLLTQFSACCDWAVQSKLIESNPFNGMAADIKEPKSTKNNEDGLDDIRGYTSEERDVIIRAFLDSPKFSKYALFVKTLFFTGMRTSELVALKWENVHETYILIKERLTELNGKQVEQQGTKTKQSRRFRINSQLREILDSIPRTDSPYVFTVDGGPIKRNNFHRAWYGQVIKGRHYGGIVTKLANDGAISYYCKAYSTRHTFINLALEAGMQIMDVARLVGNSPNVILESYVRGNPNVEIPQL